ncbi:MAG: hypothetical protein ACFFEY_00950 [Candidatus Thorarchaeota archaeon]
MLFQYEWFIHFIYTLFTYTINIGIPVVAFIFGYLIYKNKKFRYGLFFLISGILSITSFLINTIFPYIFKPMVEIIWVILMFVSIIINILGAAYLILAIYKVYETHKTDITK